MGYSTHHYKEIESFTIHSQFERRSCVVPVVTSTAYVGWPSFTQLPLPLPSHRELSAELDIFIGFRDHLVVIGLFLLFPMWREGRVGMRAWDNCGRRRGGGGGRGCISMGMCMRVSVYVCIWVCVCACVCVCVLISICMRTCV